jgi:hypothetical protein
MVGRTRNRVFTATSGPMKNNLTGALSGHGQINRTSQTCQDVTGYGDCFGLIINSISIEGGVINWPNPNTFGSSFTNYIADGLRNLAFGDHIGVSGVPGDVEASTIAAARTNPSRPHVDVPASVLDIHLAPGRIRDHLRDLASRQGWRMPPRPSARELARGGGQAWLRYNFGIAPIVSDIVRMQQAHNVVDDRVKEIDRLYSSNGLRRTVTVFSGSANAVSSSSVLQSAGTFIQPRFDICTAVTKRVHIRWAPQSRTGIPPSPEQRRAWAVRAALGLTVDASTLWELVPWSWLADYFGNVGTYLKATRNIIPARLIGVYPMTHTRTVWECPAVSNIQNGVLRSMTPVRSVRERKSRTSSFIAPLAHFNFLDGRQMGILAAVAAARS